MSDNTSIEWTDATWNPITGCAVVSPGCTNCYAMRLSGTRLAHHPSRAGLTRHTKAGPVWTGEVRFNEEWLNQPLGWAKPRMIFVCAHGDLFAEGVPDAWIDKVFAVMALAPQHTFQVLTKRPARMRQYLNDIDFRSYRIAKSLLDIFINDPKTIGAHITDEHFPFEEDRADDDPRLARLPLPNVWLGVSVEDQARANERTPILLDTPAAVRWISAEPLLGPMDLRQFHGLHNGATNQTHDALSGYSSDTPYGYVASKLPYPLSRGKLDWVVAGGESGPNARPMHPDWARSLRDQCAAAGVPFLFKQWGEWVEADHLLSAIERTGLGDGLTVDGEPWDPARPLSCQDAQVLALTLGVRFQNASDGSTYLKIGKKAAGRLLDGVLHDEFPERRP